MSVNINLCLIVALVIILPGFIALSGKAAGKITEIKIISEEWKGYTNSDGTGAYWEVLKSIYEPAGIKVKTFNSPWKRAEHDVIRGNYDAIIGSYYEKHRENKDFLYPQWHISIEDPVIGLFKKEQSVSWTDFKKSKLSGRKVSWIRGYGFENSITSGLNVDVHEVQKNIQILKMLNSKRIDMGIGYLSNFKNSSNLLKLDFDKRYSFIILKAGKKLFAAFSNRSRSKKLINMFDQRMSELAKSEKIESIYKRWGFGKDKFSKNQFSVRSP